jgi:hypothetical protein
MAQANQLGHELQNDLDEFLLDEEYDPCVRAITFDSPENRKLSIGTLIDQREEVSLLKRSAELDAERDFIEEYHASMEGNFALAFAEITKRRINCRRIAKKEFDVYELIDSLNLPEFPYLQWPAMIEDAIIRIMQ